MSLTNIKFRLLVTFILIQISILNGHATSYAMVFQQQTQPDSTKKDSIKSEKYEPSFRPTFNQTDRYGDPFSNTQSPSPLLLDDPSNLELELEIDTGMNYTISEKIGALHFRPRSTMSFDEFQRYQDKQANKEYWQNRSAGLDGESAVSSRRLIPKLYISPVFDRIFGGDYIDIQPNGFVTLDFGGRWRNVQNPLVPVAQQRNGGFNYNQQISMNVIGKIGEKLAVTANFDNNNSFDFQNNLKVEFTGYEEDIIKKIEIGNVSMPVSNSLINGGQSLFGVKTQLQFGKLYVTALASQQRGTVKSVSPGRPNTQGSGDNYNGAIKATEYDEYRHFFLGHYFRDHYEEWLSNLPNPKSSVMIGNLQVYVVRNGARNQVDSKRNIVALADLGEAKHIGNNNVTTNGTELPSSNDANDLFEKVIKNPRIRDMNDASKYLSELGLLEYEDFVVKPNVIKLDPTEYSFQQQLGYLTLRSPLNDGEVLAVAYQYNIAGQPPKTVGELPTANSNTDSDRPLILKLLKSTKPNIDKPIWDLAMKNIYTINGARGKTEQDFKLKILYDDHTTNYKSPNLNEGINTNSIPLLRVLKLDQLNKNNDPQPDAFFDFIEDITFDKENGSVIFPVLEPFGTTLASAFDPSEEKLIEKYVFHELYSQTKTNAKQNFAVKNQFFLFSDIEGFDQKEIYIDAFSVAEGSVKVMSGSQVLTEQRDYSVTYVGGAKITLLNPAYNANNVTYTYEETDVFSFTSKWLTGTRLDYKLNDKTNFGATLMHMSERTGGISRYTTGNEPVKNTQYGFDVNFQDDSRILTKAVDALPLLSTKEKSTVSFNGEFAQLIPGTTNTVNGENTSYIDDFENTATPISLEGGSIGWKLGSVPKRFDLSINPDNDLRRGYKRAKLAWYTLDRSIYIDAGGTRPSTVTRDDLSNPYVKPILAQDIYPNQSVGQVVTTVNTFDLAYYPNERGPYNYNPDDLNELGKLNNPKDNFGSIMRMIPGPNDLNRQNVEYIEFWLLDPFSDEIPLGPDKQRNQTGGKLFINLGTFSEDIMFDGIPTSENGLPNVKDKSDAETAVTNNWGRMAISPPLNNFFENDADKRANQDIGLDGLSDDQEADFFSPHMAAGLDKLSALKRSAILADLSADDYKFYLDPSYDISEAGILERYKNINGMDGNSPLSSANSNFSSAGTNVPDNEDLNGDNDVGNKNEEYFEYQIDLNQNSLAVGQKYIVDKSEDSQRKTWYLFRIPVQNPTNKIGKPSFNYFQFIRMYMTDWEQPVILRMFDFNMIASQWRKSNKDLTNNGFGVVPEPSLANFDISVVGIEQNGSKDDANNINYVLPPGINRDLDNTAVNVRQVNEQSIRLCVSELEDGDARAAFKANTTVDLVNYNNLRMFFHAESMDLSDEIADGEVTGFLRLAYDETNNYYEIEVPLKVTSRGLKLNDDDYRRAVWPEENEINIALEELYQLKSDRNKADKSVTERFTQLSGNGKYKITVIGNPKLSDIQYMMIGVRNPKESDNPIDDGASKSVCIWANELRVTGYSNSNSWAANARMNVKLADFANISASTAYSSAGFGGIQQGVSERSRQSTFQYGVTANVNIDKLIPWETGIRLPMAVTYAEAKSTPQFDPIDNDKPLEVSLQEFNTEEEGQDYKDKVIQQSVTKGIAFSNVGKDKVKEDAKRHIYDIENFTFNYAYSEKRSSDHTTAEFIDKRYAGSVAYQYTMPTLVIEPFKKSEGLTNKYLQLIKDINFSPLPSNFSATASLDRMYRKTQNWNNSLTTDGIPANYERTFYFDRVYSLRWAFTKNLSLDYGARVNAIVDEFDYATQAKDYIPTDVTGDSRQIMWENIKNMGRTKNFSQTIGITYRLPLDKIPMTDWMSADYRYNVDYHWQGNSISQQKEYGNTIDNGRTQSLNGKFDMVKLYNKVEFLKKINSPPKPSRNPQKDTVRQTNPAAQGILKFLMALRSVNFTYSLRESTVLPGLKFTPYLFGLDGDFAAPGYGFLLGSQDPNVRIQAADNGWLARGTNLTTPFMQQRTEDISLKGQLEPFKDFKVQIDMRRSNSSNYQEIFRNTKFDSLAAPFYESLSPFRTGSYSISFMPIATSLTKDGADNQSSTFDQYVENRAVIAERLGSNFGINSQDVLIPAFIAAYSGKSADEISLTPFPKIPFPNWRVDYAGLSKIPSLQTIFSSVTLSHDYKSNFMINSYTTGIDYSSSTYLDLLDLNNNILDYPKVREKTLNGTYPSIKGQDDKTIPLYTINQVSISERYSPLIGLNVRTKSNVTAKIEYSRERNLLLDLNNAQVSETRSSDVTFDVGVSTSQLKFPFKVQGRTVVIKNDMQFRLSFTVKDTKSFQRFTNGDAPLVPSGNINYQIRPTVSYVANEKLNITMYYERNINQPKTSSSFNQTATSFGIQLRFSLAQ